MRSTTYRFCVDVCLPDRRWARASVPLWCIRLLARLVGLVTRLRDGRSWVLISKGEMSLLASIQPPIQWTADEKQWSRETDH